MKTLRVLVLCLLAFALPVQGMAATGQLLCHPSGDRVQHVETSPSAHPHDHHAVMASAHQAAQPDAAQSGIDNVTHTCSHCALCCLLHAMASTSEWAVHWPGTAPAWVGSVPQLHGRMLLSTLDRPPRLDSL